MTSAEAPLRPRMIFVMLNYQMVMNTKKHDYAT